MPCHALSLEAASTQDMISNDRCAILHDPGLRRHVSRACLIEEPAASGIEKKILVLSSELLLAQTHVRRPSIWTLHFGKPRVPNRRGGNQACRGGGNRCVAL